MNSLNDLVTTYSFRGKDYLVAVTSAKTVCGNFEIKVTDKNTSEGWAGSYDASYIENLTKKTGNFKRFETFISMIKSGLLNTSHCVALDLLTFDDLEMLRSRKSSHTWSYATPHSTHAMNPNNNKRYLIVTYTVEFDRIHYPLAMEYCGLPDPRILQETIHRLEKQISSLQKQLEGGNWNDVANQINSLQKKVVDVTTENMMLKEQVSKMSLKSRVPRKDTDELVKTIHYLENQLHIQSESVVHLQKENNQLSFQLAEASKTEKFLRSQLNSFLFEPFTKSKNQKNPKKFFSSSPSRNRSLENIAEKPFPRYKLGDRRVNSARSSLNLSRSSSEEGIAGADGDKRKLRQGFQFKVNVSPKPRASSPSFSDVSHNSSMSRCVCRNCLRTKYSRQDNDTVVTRKREKTNSKAKMLKRIQSLEKLINNFVFN